MVKYGYFDYMIPIIYQLRIGFYRNFSIFANSIIKNN